MANFEINRQKNQKLIDKKFFNLNKGYKKKIERLKNMKKFFRYSF